MPDPQLLVRTFGSLMDAYDAAGLPASPKYAFVTTKKRLVSERSNSLRKSKRSPTLPGAPLIEQVSQMQFS
jgi:hypothetical protein